MNKEIFDKIKDDIFVVTFNMNDTFYYATADFSSIEIEDLEDLEPIIEKYGRSALTAYEAIKRGHDPQIPSRITDEFTDAKVDILAMIESGDKYSPFYDLKWNMKIEPNPILKRKKKAKIMSKVRQYFSFFGGR